MRTSIPLKDIKINLHLFIIVEVYGGVVGEVSVFRTKKNAVAYVEKIIVGNNFKRESEELWSNGDNDITLWQIGEARMNPSSRFCN